MENCKREKPVKVTEFIVTEAYAGKKELKDVLVDLLYATYGREVVGKLSVKS